MNEEVKPKRGGIVFYDAGAHQVRANVRTVHRDGAITVEPMFFIGPAGTDLAGYIGGRVRLSANSYRAAVTRATGGEAREEPRK